MFKWIKGRISIREYEKHPVPIVADAAVASVGIQEGKFTPLVILDTTKRPDVVELVRIHQHLPSGDAECQWGQPPGKKNKLTLYLKFIRPSEVNIILEFDLERQHGLIDQIIRSGGIYIQPGRVGDRLSATSDMPKILISIPDTGFKSTWEKMFQRSLIASFKSRGGLNSRDAERAAESFIKEWREFGNFRMPS